MFNEEILAKIKESKVITIFCHKNPDGDAYGSSFGMKYIIEENFPDKKVYCIGEKVSIFEEMMGHIEVPELDVIQSSLAIILDLPDLPRIGSDLYKYARDIVKIDHHIFVEHFGSVEWVDTSYCAVCAMVTHFAKETNLKINEKAATCLYLGLCTDNGRFQFQFDPLTFELAAHLSRCGANIEYIYDEIYKRTAQEARFWGYASSKFKTTTYGLAYNKLYPEELIAAGFDPKEAGGIVNCLANIEGIEAWAHFSQNADGTVRAELRSKGLPVNLIANKYGGGGHLRASGATLLNWDEVNYVIADIDKALLENKNYYEQYMVAVDAYNKAKEKIIEVWKSSDWNVKTKSDDSPVTRADYASNEVILKTLKEKYPDYGYLSEETKDDLSRLNKDYVWIIDPLDGTKDFVEGQKEFAVNIALSYKGQIVMGIIGVPLFDKYYFAFKNGGAYVNEKGVTRRINVTNKVDDLIVLRSKYHVTKEEDDRYKQYYQLISKVIPVGSAYKHGLIAEGKADVAFKYGPKTNLWDIAPGVIIVKEAGGLFISGDGKEFRFDIEDVRNLHGYIISNKIYKEFIKEDK